MKITTLGKKIMPHHTVNGTLFIAVRHRYMVRVIFPLYWDFHDF